MWSFSGGCQAEHNKGICSSCCHWLCLHGKTNHSRFWMESRLGPPLPVDLGSVVLFCIRVQLLSKYGQRTEPEGMKCPPRFQTTSQVGKHPRIKKTASKIKFQQYATVSLSTAAAAAACRKLGADRKRTTLIAKKSSLGRKRKRHFFPNNIQKSSVPVTYLQCLWGPLSVSMTKHSPPFRQ